MPHNGNDDQDNLASSDEIKVFKDEGEEGPSASAETSADLKDLKSSLITEGETNFHPSRREPNKLSPMVGGPHPTTSPLSFMMHHREFLQPPPAHMGIHYDPKAGIRPPVYPLSGQYSHAVFPEFTQQLQWHTPYPTMTASSAFRGSYLPNLSGVPSSGFTNFSPPSLIPPHPGLAAHHHPGLPQLGGTNQKHQDFAALVALNALNSNHHHHHHHHRHQHHESLTNGLNTWGCLTSYPHSLGLGSACGDQKPNLNHLSGGLGSSSSSNGVGGGGGSSSGSGSSNAGGAIRSPSSANHPMSSPTTPDYNSKHASGQNNHATSSNNNNGNKSSNNSLKHVKKPLNAFMLYMKDKRSQVVAECTLKESAAINQILGKRWHSLPREEQAKYYDMARKERQLHLQLYPGWTAKDNYAVNQKKKKKKRDKSSDGEGGSLKKCRARYGLDNQNRWCKPCRRKKKCTKFLENGDGMNESELDNINSVESLEPPTPDSRSANETDSENMNMSSAELSLSSPPVPNSDYHMVPQLNSSNSSSGGSGGNRLSQHQPMSHSDLTPRSLSSSSSSTLNSLSHSCPPRNSPKCPNNPLSVEQLTRPHHPPMRPSMPHSSMNNHNNTHCISVSTPTSRSDPISIPQLPTPPSTDSSSASGPQMLTVA